jgi:dTDP-4-dehydrorhamnose 3,5-epimerase-like enzyme
VTVKYPLGYDAEGRPYVELMELPRYEDQRGSLYPLDFQALPFAPKRLFVVSAVPVGTVRGRHSHKSQLQAIVCLAGAIEVELKVAARSASLVLDQPGRLLLIQPGVWTAQKFIEEHSVELVLASGPYEPEGYSQEC